MLNNSIKAIEYFIDEDNEGKSMSMINSGKIF